MRITKSPERSATKQFYSFHTATLSALLTSHDYHSIVDILYSESRNNPKTTIYKGYPAPADTGHRFQVTDEWGFNIIELKKCQHHDRRTDKLYTRYQMKIKINPRAMFHRKVYPYLYIASLDDIKAAIKRLKEFLNVTHLTPFVTFERFKVTRLDLCVNIDLGANSLSEEYMRILRKGNNLYHMIRMKKYNPSQKRWVPTKHSFTITSAPTAFIEFSCYNKYKQLENEDKKYTTEEVSAAKGIIRIELRMSHLKILQEKQKLNISTEEDILLNANILSEDNIPRYIKSCFGAGYFTTTIKAKQKILDSSCHMKTKQSMIDMVERASSKGQTLEKIKCDIGKKKFSSLMKLFNQLGISPLTIRAKANIERMENPLYYIHYANANYPK